MADHSGEPDRAARLGLEQLPPSLRFKGVQFADVYADHVNLVVYRDPDVQHGARIWKKGAARPHADHSTKYPGITFYRYNADLPESPENIL